MKIAILSDTHNILRDSVCKQLKECEMILHAGDIGERVLQQLEHMAPLYCVRGNNDKEAWADRLPYEIKGKLGELTYYMVHDKKDISKDLGHVNLIIYGHSHKYDDKVIEDIRYLNPGSCGRKRFSLPLTMIIATVEGENIEVCPIEIV